MAARFQEDSQQKQLQARFPSTKNLQIRAPVYYTPAYEAAVGANASTPLKPVPEMFGVSVAASRQSAVSLRFDHPAPARPPLSNVSLTFPRFPEPPRKGPEILLVNFFATWPLPNPSFNRTCYGGRRKAGLQHSVHHRKPALRHPPQKAG